MYCVAPSCPAFNSSFLAEYHLISTYTLISPGTQKIYCDLGSYRLPREQVLKQYPVNATQILKEDSESAYISWSKQLIDCVMNGQTGVPEWNLSLVPCEQRICIVPHDILLSPNVSSIYSHWLKKQVWPTSPATQIPTSVAVGVIVEYACSDGRFIKSYCDSIYQYYTSWWGNCSSM